MACRSRFERLAREAGFAAVAGLDEVGRGALFGPVFAAAVVLGEKPLRGLRDSKVLEPERREELAQRIRERARAWAVAAADPFEIDRRNILQASRLAMKRAVEKLAVRCDYLLIDAVTVELPLAQKSLIHGDARCPSIAAASIIAKVARDAAMADWDRVFPQYNLASNKGYSTPDHLRALALHGPTSLHRFSFQPVRESSPFPAWQGYPILKQIDLFAFDTAAGSP